jgi:hypothetical protein
MAPIGSPSRLLIYAGFEEQTRFQFSEGSHFIQAMVCYRFSMPGSARFQFYCFVSRHSVTRHQEF